MLPIRPLWGINTIINGVQRDFLRSRKKISGNKLHAMQLILAIESSKAEPSIPSEARFTAHVMTGVGC